MIHFNGQIQKPWKLYGIAVCVFYKYISTAIVQYNPSMQDLNRVVKDIKNPLSKSYNICITIKNPS